MGKNNRKGNRNETDLPSRELEGRKKRERRSSGKKGKAEKRDGGGRLSRELELEWLGLIKPSPHQSSKESQEHRQLNRQRRQRFLLDRELRSLLDTQKSIRQQAMNLHQQLLGSIDPTSNPNPRAHEQAMLMYEQAVAPLSSSLQSRAQEIQQLMSQLPGSSNLQAHQLPVDCSGDTPRRSARLKAKATESPEGERPTKRERRSSGKKGKADKKDAGDGQLF